MKIYTNESNVATLKLIISAKLGGKNVEVCVIQAQGPEFRRFQRLPILELDSNRRIILPNAASRFMFPPEDQYSLYVDEWLEWDAVTLSPSVLSFLANTAKPDIPAKTRVEECLANLDSHLAEKRFLVAETVSVADVVLWCTVYPLLTNPQQTLKGSNTNVSEWFKRLLQMGEVKEALKTVKIAQGVDIYRPLVAGTWVPTNALTTSQVESSSHPDSPVKEVPISEVELATILNTWQTGIGSQVKPKPQATPVLPVPGENNILITSALPYVNNVPHLGNIIGCVLSADVFARYCRLCTRNTLFICGTDEYGTATETKALEEGLSPQEICDKYFKIHEAVYRWFNISFDYFGRTTTPQQTSICQELFMELHKAGYTCKETMEQLLCENCDRYLADRFVEGTCPYCAYEDARGDQCDGCGHLINATELKSARCKVCQQTPVIRHSEQFFLDLPKIEPKLETWLDTVSMGWSSNARVIAKTWLKDGLKARCITRDLKWGIPVPLPEYSDKVFYVWFDAPIGYLSMTSCYTDQWKLWWQPDKDTKVTLYQFMAKDNVPFHSVMFPGTLLCVNQGHTLVSHIMATEYLNYEDGKFSKSRGVGVFGTDAQDTGIPADVWRFYLLYVRPETQDSSFSWTDLATRNNSELLNNLGNFVNRALAFTEKNFEGVVPPISLKEIDLKVLALVDREVKCYKAALDRSRLRDGIRHILAISRHGNQYMQSQQPWVLVKGSESERTQAATVVGLCCNISCLLATLLSPYMPQTAETLWEQLQAPAETRIITGYVWQMLPAGHKLGKPEPLFSKIKQEVIETLKVKFSGQQKSCSPNTDPQPAVQTDIVGKEAIEKLEKAIIKQQQVVLQCKSAPELSAHEQTLCDLKKNLMAARQANGIQTEPVCSSSLVPELEAAINKQGDLVRQLKASGVPKSKWQPEVTVLLELKQKLAAAQGVPSNNTTSRRKK